MLDDAELEELLGDLESDRAERKSALTDKDRICQAVCAFANDLPGHRAPGVAFIGANDDGSPSGLPVTDQLLLDLANIRSDGNVLPLPAMTVQKRRLRGADMAVVEVEPSDAPPVRYRGRVWVRVGPRRAVASAQEERLLAEKRRSRDLTFDARPMQSATLADLDLDLFARVYLPSAVAPDVLEQNERSREDQLRSLRFVSPDGVPTAAGLLVVGSDPRRYLPGAYVQFVRIDGTELTDPVKDDQVIDGPLPEVVRLVEEVLNINVSVAVDFADRAVEERVPDYPVAALQQLVRNAVLHRDYETTNAPVRLTWFSDRVEIQSPGGPYGQVTVGSFGTPGLTDYRNPLLAEAMRALGFVQRFGMGIPLARRSLERNGSPPLGFQVNENQVLVAVRARS
jgi:ATP-dependent DNA helicase RecG